MDWVEDQFVVTRAQKGEAEGVAPGDRVLKIDGKPDRAGRRGGARLISGATEGGSATDPPAELQPLQAESEADDSSNWSRSARPGTSKIRRPRRAVRPSSRILETYTETRPAEKIAELEPGILYVDLDRVTTKNGTAVVPRLEKAEGHHLRYARLSGPARHSGARAPER